MNIIHFKILDSTNAYLKRNYEKFDDFQIVSASHQTEGKGRLGNIWLDDGNALLFSILIKREIKMESVAQIPLLVAMVTHQVLLPHIPDLKIKWPNDLLINHKKLAGILIETISSNHEIQAIIIGIGINLYSTEFHPSIQETATSFLLETNQEISSSLLMEEIVKRLEDELELFKQNQSLFITYCKKYSSLLGKEISFIHQNKIMHGIAKDIKDNGNLLVKTSHAILEISTGEIHLIK